ncbi:hypothetical protein [Clostridium sp.]|uniref:hypothetical protein n=1 Tax=Clostridium sp. TaxID=1506 RepID=UPI003F3F2CA1
MKADIVTGLLIQMFNLYNIPLDEGYKILLENGLLDKIPEEAKEDEFYKYLDEVKKVLS